MANNNLHEEMDWAEALPDKCPPEGAFNPDNFICFRISLSGHSADIDFRSHRFLHPTREFSADECIAKAVSVFSSIEACKNLFKLPTFKSKNTIIKLNLNAIDGLVLSTGRQDHYSWWRTNSFDYTTTEIIRL